MGLSKPEYSFTIPSVHDDTILDCRLYHPKEGGKPSALEAPRAAIVAHPYAPLGGCYDDPVVDTVGAVLLKAGYVVGTFNFRYCSDSCTKARAIRHPWHQCQGHLALHLSVSVGSSYDMI